MYFFIHKEDQDIYYRHRNQVLATVAAQVFELRLKKSDEAIFWGQQVAAAGQDGDGLPAAWRN